MEIRKSKATRISIILLIKPFWMTKKCAGLLRTQIRWKLFIIWCIQRRRKTRTLSTRLKVISVSVTSPIKIAHFPVVTNLLSLKLELGWFFLPFHWPFLLESTCFYYLFCFRDPIDKVAWKLKLHIQMFVECLCQ